jgi:hypothetical protein
MPINPVLISGVINPRGHCHIGLGFVCHNHRRGSNTPPRGSR